MPKKPIVASKPSVDPTLPKVELELDGEKYFLCFTFAALSIAEAKLRASGIECNLLKAMDFEELDATKFVPLLYSALITHKPSVTIEAVAGMVKMPNVGRIYQALVKAYADSLAEPTDAKENPPKPE